MIIRWGIFDVVIVPLRHVRCQATRRPINGVSPHHTSRPILSLLLSRIAFVWVHNPCRSHSDCRRCRKGSLADHDCLDHAVNKINVMVTGIVITVVAPFLLSMQQEFSKGGVSEWLIQTFRKEINNRKTKPSSKNENKNLRENFLNKIICKKNMRMILLKILWKSIFTWMAVNRLDVKVDFESGVQGFAFIVLLFKKCRQNCLPVLSEIGYCLGLYKTELTFVGGFVACCGGRVFNKTKTKVLFCFCFCPP